MKKIVLLFFACAFLFCPLQAKEPKVLILIIASDNSPAYAKLQKIWEAYMHTDPEHFTCYFIRGNPDLESPYKIVGNDLFVKTEEGYVPGITNKTVLSIEAMLPKLHKYEYVIRTNLSSFYVFPRLLAFVDTLPKTGCYCGFQQHIPAAWLPKFGLINFISGAGIILSSDLAEMLVTKKESLLKYSTEMPDDVLFGYFFQNNHIQTMPGPRTDFPNREAWLAGKDSIPETAFHFRAKNNFLKRSPKDSYEDELFINHELLKMFYNK